MRIILVRYCRECPYHRISVEGLLREGQGQLPIPYCSSTKRVISNLDEITEGCPLASEGDTESVGVST